MLRYVATAAAALSLLAAALCWRARTEAAPLPDAPGGAPIEQPDEVHVGELVGGGREVAVRHHLAGQLSRASLVYEMDGAEKTVDEATNCEQSLRSGRKIREEEQGTVVELRGTVPEGACRVNLVLVDETGTREIAVPLQ